MSQGENLLEKYFEMCRGQNNKFCFVFLHGNEVAAGRVARNFAAELACGGVFFLGLERYFRVAVGLKGEAEIDANRFWTSGPVFAVGGKKLFFDENSAVYTRIRHELFWPMRQFLEEYKTLISLHNNGTSDFSFRSFLEGGLRPHAKKIFQADSKNSGDFVIVTQAGDFDKLAKFGFLNLVLQSRNVNDGSLSVWAAKNGIRYFNVETFSRLNQVETECVQKNILLKILSVIE